MKFAMLIVALAGLSVAPAAAQGRRNNASIPPGHLPPPGACRVWYEGVPPGQQPPPTSCDQAERVASRSRDARVIYGSDRGGWNRNDRWGRDDGRVIRQDDRAGRDDGRRRDGRPARGRAVPRGNDYPGTYYPDNRYPQSGNYGSVPYRNGYQDGIEKAREDTRDGDRYDPARHGWYKSANRGYDNRYGSRDRYAQEYRDGFLDGYRQNYRGSNRSGPSWWPF